VDETWRNELQEFLAIPSVSAEPAHREDVKRAGEWVCDFIRRIGGTAELTPFGEKELALGDFRAFEYARPALRLLLDAATPFDDDIPRDVPVTIAWAARDLVLPLWQAAVAKEVVPHAVHVTMRGVGHIPMFDDPALVAEVLLRGSEPIASVARLDTAQAARRTTGRRKPASESA